MLVGFVVGNTGTSGSFDRSPHFFRFQIVQEAAVKTMNRIAPTASNSGVVVSNVESGALNINDNHLIP